MKSLFRLVSILLPLFWCGPSLMAADVVPLKVVHQLPVVSLCINGHGPYELLLDTGTESTLVDQKLAQELQLAIVDRTQLISANGMHPVGRAIAATVTLGPEKLTEVELLVDDLRELHAVAPQLRGILGQNVLKQFNFLLDYRRRQVELDPAIEEETGVRIPFEVEDGRIILAVQISATQKLRLQLDSGATHPMLFRAPGRFTAQPASMAFLSNNEGTTQVHEAHLAELRIGPIVLHDLKVGLVESSTEAFAQIDGLLPTNLFDSVYFDFAGRSISVTGKKITPAERR